MRIRFTDARIRELVARGIDPSVRDSRGKPKPVICRDLAVLGLFIEINQYSASWKIQTTSKSRKTIRHTLGRTSDLTVQQARRKADEILGQIRRGDVIAGAQLTETASVPTLGDALGDHVLYRERKGMSADWTEIIQLNFRTHLPDWLCLPVDKITRRMVVDRHTEISKRGMVTANSTIRNLRTVLNGVPDLPNPVRQIAWFRSEPRRDDDGRVVTKDVKDLVAWWQNVDRLDNPIRLRFHKLQLLSGMRPGHLAATRWGWVGEDHIYFPRLKAGRDFTLPLSAPMKVLVEELQGFSQGPFVFPAASAAGHLESWREKDLQTGHALRHTYVTIARTVAIPDDHRRLLVDHTIPGIHGQYGSVDRMFPQLLQSQELISKRILSLRGF